MTLEFDLRLFIFVLGIALLSACDRQKPEAPQGSDAAPAAAKGADRSHAGSPAPTAQFRDPEGEPASLADFAGKPVLVNLWATWCAPCVKELPTLDALAAKGGALQVVTVSQDMGDQAKVRDFLEQRGLKRLETWQDSGMALPSALGVQTLPTTILYDSAGKELWRYVGDLDWTGAEAAELLREAK
jgi:thiol-disulfide isomerase/thioredoxin